MNNLISTLKEELDRIHEANTFKYETEIESAQSGVVKVDGAEVVMLASNNYLGLSNHPKIIEAAIRGITEYGHGVASVRFLCGTQTIHRELEKRIARFLGKDDSILFSSCFAANEGLFASIFNEPLGSENWQDVIYTDQFNHASIIDGMRLCRPKSTVKRIYKHMDTDELRQMLQEDKDKDYRFRLLVTDGVFSMEGDLSPLPELIDLCEEFRLTSVIDDSHALGVIGETGRGTPEELGVHGKIDIITGTLGKAMGGAAGGFIAGDGDLITYLRQKSRPYTFSNSLPPSIVIAAIQAFDLLDEDPSIIGKLKMNTEYFRKEIKSLGFTILDGVHPIVPIMLGEASLAQEMAKSLLDEGVYIKGLWFPVVPRGEARLRTQISAALEMEDIDLALTAFEKVGKKMELLN